MKKILWIAFLLIPMGAFAQAPVNVTATITSPNGALYQYGTWQVQLVNSSGQALQQYQVGPTTFTQSQQNGYLGATASLSVNLVPNSYIYPNGSLWQFLICTPQSDQVNPVYYDVYQTCFSSNVTVTTAGSYSTSINANAAAIYANNYQSGTAYTTTSSAYGFVGSGSVSFTVGAAAGSSPGTPVCATGHVCDTTSGVVSLTMGTSTTTGVLLTVTVTPTTLRTNQGNCDGSVYLVASPYTQINIRYTGTTAPTTYVANVGSAPTASTAYEITYQCMGN